MNRIRKTLVVAIIGVVMLGFGLIAAVDAVKPPFMPPDFDPYPGYPDAVRIRPGLVGNWIYQSEASFIMQPWVYYVDEAEPVDERELFPQPIRVQVWIKSSSGDWCEIKLSRNAVGNGHLINPYFVGPVYLWYAYFEPGYFAVGEYETHVQYTCKNPDNPSERMFCWDTDPTSPTYGMDLNFYGSLTVLDG
ncbi:MAG: hypothetical protein ACXAC0_01095 [Candidatus Thorarchaeota archaeon]|jgi:hypothetical protein